MRGKIISATSEHGKEFIGMEGNLILDYEGDGKLHIERDDGKYLNMTRIKKMIVETQNTTYEIEVVSND
jgi:hypothetical protein